MSIEPIKFSAKSSNIIEENGNPNIESNFYVKQLLDKKRISLAQKLENIRMGSSNKQENLSPQIIKESLEDQITTIDKLIIFIDAHNKLGNT